MSKPTQLSATALAQLEARIRQDDWRAMWAYADDAMHHHLYDEKEVYRRQKVLVDAMREASHGGAFIAASVLSAVTEEEPGLGYLAWRRIAFHH